MIYRLSIKFFFDFSVFFLLCNFFSQTCTRKFWSIYFHLGIPRFENIKIVDESTSSVSLSGVNVLGRRSRVVE